MNLASTVALYAQTLDQTCGCPLKVGHRVKVEGLKSVGTIRKRIGRRLTVQFADGVRVEKDQRFVHPG